MSMSRRAAAAGLALWLAGAGAFAVGAAAGEGTQREGAGLGVAVEAAARVQVKRESPGLGRPASAEEIAGWDTTIAPDGSGLPPGGGTAREGEALYDQRCAACHGPKGMGRSAEELVGDVRSLTTDFPDKTVGSYWPYATTLYDYVRRAMPMDAPRSLTADQVYAICAYVLFLNGIIAWDAEMNAKTLAAVEMPNRDGFVIIYQEPPM